MSECLAGLGEVTDQSSVVICGQSDVLCICIAVSRRGIMAYVHRCGGEPCQWCSEALCNPDSGSPGTFVTLLAINGCRAPSVASSRDRVPGQLGWAKQKRKLLPQYCQTPAANSRVFAPRAGRVERKGLAFSLSDSSLPLQGSPAFTGMWLPM